MYVDVQKVYIYINKWSTLQMLKHKGVLVYTVCFK